MDIPETKEEAAQKVTDYKRYCEESRAREAMAATKAAAARTMADWPNSPKEYRERLMAFYLRRTEEIRAVLQSMGGFGVDRDVIEAFDEAVGEIESMLPAATVRFSQAAKQRNITWLQSEVARSDPKFVRFLAAIAPSADALPS